MKSPLGSGGLLHDDPRSGRTRPGKKEAALFISVVNDPPPALLAPLLQGIIGKDGCMGEFVTLPVANLHLVPDELSDSEAAFAEPLAAACHILEQVSQRRRLTRPTIYQPRWYVVICIHISSPQGLLKPGSGDVAVIGDGKLGLLVAQVLVASGMARVTLLGRHASKMALVEGVHRTLVLQAQEPATGCDQLPATSCDTTHEAGVPDPDPDPLAAHEGKFELVVEASGSSGGILAALRLTRPMGTILLKSTVSEAPSGGGGVQWAKVANDLVVNEKTLVGSRCGSARLSSAGASVSHRKSDMKMISPGRIYDLG